MKQNNDPLNPPSTDFCTLEYDCAYLPDKKVRMYYRYTSQAGKPFSSAVIERGWRRFGNYYFHPICNGCNACKSLRIDVENFRASKSQRRTIRKNKNTTILVQKPSLSNQHLDLYNRYHKWKSEKDGWKHREIKGQEYYENFVEGAHDFGREVLYFQNEKLIGVDLIDILDDGISAIYFFHDPDFKHLSLGTYSLLMQIRMASILNKRWIYLGYWVDGCKAFAYKSRFKPLEILDGFPPNSSEAEWKEWDGESVEKMEESPILPF